VDGNCNTLLLSASGNSLDWRAIWVRSGAGVIDAVVFCLAGTTAVASAFAPS